MTRFQVFLRVVLFHALILVLIVVLPMLKSFKWFPEKEQIITVDLASLPPLPPPPEEADDPEDDEEVEDVISEATPVPTPPPSPTATPAPEATAVPTATPRPQPTPTPTPGWKAVSAEEIARRIQAQENPDPPAAVPTLSAEEIQRRISQGLPTGGMGNAIGAGNPGAGVNLGGVESELQRRLLSAWDQPFHLSAQTGIHAVASVQVLKNGNISSSRILKSSGNSEYDASVKKALSAVKFAKALPAEYTGSVYNIEITFRLSQ